MNNLQKAINHFSQRFVESGGDTDYSIMADALKEIRDLLTADKQSAPAEQPATFEPWHDVVVVIGPDAAGDHGCVGFEGFVTRRDEDNYLRVQLGEDGHWSYFPASSLRLVYRLRPRAQPEPQPYAGSVMTDVGKEPTNEDLLHAAGYTQKPAPFQVGDWIETNIRTRWQITEIADGRVYGRCDGFRVCAKIGECVKIDPPTLRFTFGDRVVYDGQTGLFIRYRPGIDDDRCQFLGLTDNEIYTCDSKQLCLLDELPF